MKATADEIGEKTITAWPQLFQMFKHLKAFY
jgi:hypothetical protein